MRDPDSSGFVHPACGGAPWEQLASHAEGSGSPAGELQLECRIGHRDDAAAAALEREATEEDRLFERVRDINTGLPESTELD